MSNPQLTENVEKVVSFWEKVQKYFFMRRVLAIIGQGLVFKKAFGLFLKIIAVCTVLGGLVLWVEGWKLISEMSRYGNAAGVIFGGLIVEVLMIILFYTLVHTLWLRAVEIENLPDSGYAVIPIIATTLKLAGELYAIFSVFSGLAGTILIWFAGGIASHMLPDLFPFYGVGTGFVAGILSLLAGFGLGLLVLVVFYFFSETTIVFVDIAGRLGKNQARAENLE